ncbi:class I SAM-dependent methyltransferase [bacterium]|nr:class I SAM-dependent methyltransferase [bacterium]
MEKTIKNALEMYNTYRFGIHSVGKKVRLDFIALLKDFFNHVDKDDNLFDIGCGRGFWFDIYKEYGMRIEKIYGLDLSPENAKELNKKGYNVICGNILEIAFNDNTADNTVCNGVIMITPDPFKAFQELIRITKPGGYILLGVYNKYNPFHWIYKFLYPIRYFYWNISKKIELIIYPPINLLFQILTLISTGRIMDKRTSKIIFMDTIMTPQCKLFSKKEIRNYARKCNAQIIMEGYNKYKLMIYSIIKINK